MPDRTVSSAKQTVVAVLFALTSAVVAQNSLVPKAQDAPSPAPRTQEFRYQAGSESSIGLSNPFGSIILRPAQGDEVVIQAASATSHVEVQHSQMGNRIEVHSRPSPRATQEEARVDYTVQVPPGATITVRSTSGSILAEGLRGDLTLESDAGAIEVRRYSVSHLMARTIGAPITVTDVPNGHVEISSVGGKLLLHNVSGARVSANTTSGNVEYDGGFAVEGEYSVTTHSGNIEVAFPPKASVEITAQSIKGRVEDEFHFQPQETPKITFTQGNWFAGTANTGSNRAGAAAVHLRSFSGTIRVTRQ